MNYWPPGYWAPAMWPRGYWPGLADQPGVFIRVDDPVERPAAARVVAAGRQEAVNAPSRQATITTDGDTAVVRPKS